MKELEVIRPRDMYQLKNSDGEAVLCSDYEELLQKTVKAVLPGKDLTVREQDMLVDQLKREEAMVFEKAIADIPELSGLTLEEITKIFCEITGEPIRGKERFDELAAEANRRSREAFEAKYGPDADEDDVIDW